MSVGINKTTIDTKKTVLNLTMNEIISDIDTTGVN